MVLLLSTLPKAGITSFSNVKWHIVLLAVIVLAEAIYFRFGIKEITLFWHLLIVADVSVFGALIYLGIIDEQKQSEEDRRFTENASKDIPVQEDQYDPSHIRIKRKDFNMLMESRNQLQKINQKLKKAQEAEEPD